VQAQVVYKTQALPRVRLVRSPRCACESSDWGFSDLHRWWVWCIRDSGIRDPGRDRGRLWKVQTLDRDSGDPGLPAGRSARDVLRVLRTKNIGDMPADFDPGKFEHVKVNAKKKKWSRCRLCGEQWWDIGPSLILERMGFIPGWEVQQKYG